MTIGSETNRWTRDGNGSIKVFPYDNKVFASSDLKVYVDNVLQTETTHYTISGVGNVGGGNVTFVTAPPTGTANVVVVRDVPKTQGTDLPIGGVFPAASVEDMADKAAILAQQNADKIARALVVSDSDPISFGPMPLLSNFFSRYLAFDAVGNPIPGVTVANQVVSFAYDTFNGTGAQTIFTLSVSASSPASTAVFISGVRQVPVTDYMVSGSTLTFTTAPATGTGNILAVHSQAYAGVPSDQSVTSAKIVAAAVTAAKIAAGAVVEVAIGADAVDWLTKVKAATAGDLPHFGVSGDPDLLAKGTALQQLRMNAGATLPEWFTPAPIFSAKYVSAEQTITAAGDLTLAHGLSVTNAHDVFVRAVLICQTAELSYTVGDTVPIPLQPMDASAQNLGVAVVPDTTSLNVRFGSGAAVFVLTNKTTGVVGAITPANWKIRFIAYV